MREIAHLQAGQCGNQIGAKVRFDLLNNFQIKVTNMYSSTCKCHSNISK